MLVWDCGDDLPLQVVSDLDHESDQDRYVTFTKPGQYVIKLAAISGKLNPKALKLAQMAFKRNILI